jgi:Arc-like DNA binding domain.
MATSKIQTGLRLPEDDLKKITYIAKKQKRSLNSQLEFAVQECIEKYEKDNGEIEVSE